MQVSYFPPPKNNLDKSYDVLLYGYNYKPENRPKKIILRVNNINLLGNNFAYTWSINFFEPGIFIYEDDNTLALLDMFWKRPGFHRCQNSKRIRALKYEIW